MSYTHDSVNGTVTLKDDNASMLDKAFNALQMPFADDNTLHTSGEVMACALVWGSAGLVGGGIAGRKRAEAGKEPIAKFLF